MTHPVAELVEDGLPDDGPADEGLAADYRSAGFGTRLPLGTRPALVVVDAVQAYVDPTSTLYAGVEIPVAVMVRLVGIARAAGIPIVFTGVCYRSDGVDGGVFWRKVPALAANFTDGNPMSRPIAGLEPGPGESLLVKKYPSAFFGTPLAATFTALDVDTVVIAGLSTSGCVRATAVDALCHGFTPLVVADAVGDRHEGPHRANLFDIAAKVGEVRPLTEVQRWLEGLRSVVPQRPDEEEDR